MLHSWHYSLNIWIGTYSELQEKKADGLCLSCTDNVLLGMHIWIIQELDLCDHLDWEFDWIVSKPSAAWMLIFPIQTIKAQGRGDVWDSTTERSRSAAEGQMCRDPKDRKQFCVLQLTYVHYVFKHGM